MIGTMAIAGSDRALWKAEPRVAAKVKASNRSYANSGHSYWAEYLTFTCVNLGMAAVMMLAIAYAFNWVAQACTVSM